MEIRIPPAERAWPQALSTESRQSGRAGGPSCVHGCLGWVGWRTENGSEYRLKKKKEKKKLLEICNFERITWKRVSSSVAVKLDGWMDACLGFQLRRERSGLERGATKTGSAGVRPANQFSGLHLGAVRFPRTIASITYGVLLTRYLSERYYATTFPRSSKPN